MKEKTGMLAKRPSSQKEKKGGGLLKELWGGQLGREKNHKIKPWTIQAHPDERTKGWVKEKTPATGGLSKKRQRPVHDQKRKKFWWEGKGIAILWGKVRGQRFP